MSFDQFRIRHLRDRRDLGSTVAIAVPLLGITASEGLLYFGYTWYALWGHLLTLLVTSLLPLWVRGETPTYQAILLVPLFRLVNLGMPVFFNLTIYWFPLIYGPLIPGLYLLKRSRDSNAQRTDSSIKSLLLPGLLVFTLLLAVDGELDIHTEPSAVLSVFWFLIIYGALVIGIYPNSRQGNSSLLRHRLKRILPVVPCILLLALFLAEIEFRILTPVALIPQWSVLNLLVISLVMFGFVGFVEELLFRGVLQPALQSRFGAIPGLLLSSGLFGLMHSGYGLPQEVVFAFVIGLLLGVIYDWTDSIGLVTILHGALNVFLFAVIPIQGSLLPK